MTTAAAAPTTPVSVSLLVIGAVVLQQLLLLAPRPGHSRAPAFAEARPRFLRDGTGVPPGAVMPAYCQALCQSTQFSGIVGGCRCSFTLFTSKRNARHGRRDGGREAPSSATPRQLSYEDDSDGFQNGSPDEDDIIDIAGTAEARASTVRRRENDVPPPTIHDPRQPIAAQHQQQNRQRSPSTTTKKTQSNSLAAEFGSARQEIPPGARRTAHPSPSGVSVVGSGGGGTYPNNKPWWLFGPEHASKLPDGAGYDTYDRHGHRQRVFDEKTRQFLKAMGLLDGHSEPPGNGGDNEDVPSYLHN